jgi:hypothetical protein
MATDKNNIINSKWSLKQQVIQIRPNTIQIKLELAWYLNLKEEHGLEMLQNKMARKIFDPKQQKVTAHWKNSHNL